MIPLNGVPRMINGVKVYVIPSVVNVGKVQLPKRWWMSDDFHSEMNRWLRDALGAVPEPNPVYESVPPGRTIRIPGAVFMREDDYARVESHLAERAVAFRDAVQGSAIRRAVRR